MPEVEATAACPESTTAVGKRSNSLSAGPGVPAEAYVLGSTAAGADAFPSAMVDDIDLSCPCAAGAAA